MNRTSDLTFYCTKGAVVHVGILRSPCILVMGRKNKEKTKIYHTV